MATLVIVPCGASKIWARTPHAGPTPARFAYTGAPFTVNRGYAERFADTWCILSAKYGFIPPDFVIPETYDVTFTDPATHPIGMSELRAQVHQQGLDRFEEVVALGGTIYARFVRLSFQGTVARVCAPVAGNQIGIMMGLVKRTTTLGQPFRCHD